jgi:hypothetical protein
VPSRHISLFRCDRAKRYKRRASYLKALTSSIEGWTMRFPVVALCGALMGLTSAAHADCTPVNSEVVSLGEKAARFYSDRSLTGAIDSEKRRIEAMGAKQGKVAKSMECAPYPNLIGADEWRCVGKGKVCSQ